MIILHCMLKKEYEVFQNESFYQPESFETDGFIHCSTWNSFYEIAPSFVKDKQERVLLCIDTFQLTSRCIWEVSSENKIEYPHIYGPLNMDSIVEVMPFEADDMEWKKKSCTHILMNTSAVDSDWCFPTLAQYIHPQDHVCVVAFSFWKDTKTKKDWEKLYSPKDGMWYSANTKVWERFGIHEDQVTWINYFQDTCISAKNKILNSSIVFFTGGAPDLMMKRIKEFELVEVLERYQGVMIGYSAGAMIQLAHYHITPDMDYPSFSYEQGLSMLDDFDIEVHYENSTTQNEYINKVKHEMNKDVYALYEEGGILVEQGVVKGFGKIEKITKDN